MPLKFIAVSKIQVPGLELCPYFVRAIIDKHRCVKKERQNNANKI